MPATIFATAYDRYALRAFDTNAIDYLLKPFSQEHFDRALARARERISARRNVADPGKLSELLQAVQLTPKYPERVPIPANGRIILINAEDIDWIEQEGKYARLHVGVRRIYDIRETLTNLEARLDPRIFVRIHRSTLVNMQRVKEIQPWFHGHHVVVLEDGTKLNMSRSQNELVKRVGT
jgi:two-component system LytT family response regulator